MLHLVWPQAAMFWILDVPPRQQWPTMTSPKNQFSWANHNLTEISMWRFISMNQSRWQQKNGQFRTWPIKVNFISFDLHQHQLITWTCKSPSLTLPPPTQVRGLQCTHATYHCHYSSLMKLVEMKPLQVAGGTGNHRNGKSPVGFTSVSYCF